MESRARFEKTYPRQNTSNRMTIRHLVSQRTTNATWKSSMSSKVSLRRTQAGALSLARVESPTTRHLQQALVLIRRNRLGPTHRPP